MSQSGISRWDKRVITQEMDREWRKQTKSILDNIDSYLTDNYKIPPIGNSVFFTSNLETVKLKDLYIKKFGICVDKLNEADSNFKHYIWTNNPNIDIGELSKFPNIEIRLITEFADHPLYNNIIKLIEKDQLKTADLVQASDIARVIVTQKYGGIYHDLDYEIFDAEPIVRYMKSFNYFNGREFDFHDSFIGNAFFACSPGHPVMNEMANLILRNLNATKDTTDTVDELPGYILDPQTSADGIFTTTGPVAMTIANYKATNKEGNIDVIFPAIVFYNAKFVNPDIKLSVSDQFYNITLKSLGADMFSGGWNEDKQKALNIEYNLTDNKSIADGGCIDNAKVESVVSLNGLGYSDALDTAVEVYSLNESGNGTVNFKENDNINLKDIDYLSLINSKIDKIYVMNLEHSHQRWSKVSKSLDKTGIPYEKFKAVNAININVFDQETNDKFTGKELKDDISLLYEDHKYTVICNPNDPKPFTFNFVHIKVDYDYSVRYLGIMCSKFMISSEVVNNKYQKVVIFEDDIEVDPTDFQEKLVRYIDKLPPTFDIGYLGVYSDKSKQIPVNEYVNKFPPEADFFCRMGLIETYKGAEKFLSEPLYWGSLDHYIRAKSVYMKIPNTDQYMLEVYVSSELQDSIWISSQGSVEL